ncbi:hypothetical protein EU77_05590 [Mesotoga sp. SC_NapDC]|nr:hypothetical protein EU77_05590 [Mesotoga sp. SC_NapDC]
MKKLICHTKVRTAVSPAVNIGISTKSEQPFAEKRIAMSLLENTEFYLQSEMKSISRLFLQLGNSLQSFLFNSTGRGFQRIRYIGEN